jgi:hypothetical protein
MKEQILYILAATVFLTACVSDNEEKAARIAAEIFKAENCFIAHSTYDDTEKRSSKIIILTLQNLKGVEKKYSKDKITSTTALTFINNVDKQDYQDFQTLKIVIENNPTFEKLYEIDKLAYTNRLLKKVSDFFMLTSGNDSSKVKPIIDNSKIQDSILNIVVYTVAQIEKEFGKLNNIKITGFRYDHITETNEPIIVTWVEATNGKAITKYSFYISSQTEKIIYVGINDEV